MGSCRIFRTRLLLGGRIDRPSLSLRTPPFPRRKTHMAAGRRNNHRRRLHAPLKALPRTGSRDTPRSCGRFRPDHTTTILFNNTPHSGGETFPRSFARHGFLTHHNRNGFLPPHHNTVRRDEASEMGGSAAHRQEPRSEQGGLVALHSRERAQPVSRVSENRRSRGVNNARLRRETPCGARGLENGDPSP